MVQSISIPFSNLNVIPGVTGIEDLEVDIPTLQDIYDAVDELVPNLPDIRDEIDEALDAAGDLVDLTDEAIDDIVDNVIDELGAIDDRIIDAVEDALAELLEDVEQSITGIFLEIDELPEEITNLLDVQEAGGGVIRLEGIFGPLAQDIAKGVEDALDGLLGIVQDVADDVAEILELLDDPAQLGLDEVLPDWLFLDLVDLATAIVVEGIDQLVDDGTTDKLQAFNDEFEP